MLTIVALPAPWATICAAQTSNSPKKEQKKVASASLSGCVDEKEGHYILVDDRNLSPVADLEADGFPTEGFAKYLGKKVTVLGTSTSRNTRPVFKVRSLETISETCAPKPEPDKK
jgi:hypothetical protein